MPVFRPGRGGYGDNGWEDTGQAIGELIASILLKRQIQAQQIFPQVMKNWEDAQVTGNPAPVERQIGTSKPLKAMFRRATGLEPPVTGEIPRLQPVDTNNPTGMQPQVTMAPYQSPVPWPTTPSGISARATQEEIAGRPLPPTMQEDKDLELARTLSTMQQQNPDLAKQVAAARGMNLPSIKDQLTPGQAENLKLSRIASWKDVTQDYRHKDGSEILLAEPEGQKFVATGDLGFLNTNDFRRATRAERGIIPQPRQRNYPALKPEEFHLTYYPAILAQHNGDRRAADADYNHRFEYYAKHDADPDYLPYDLTPAPIRNPSISQTQIFATASRLAKETKGQYGTADVLAQQLLDGSIDPNLMLLDAKMQYRDDQNREVLRTLSNPSVRKDSKTVKSMLETYYRNNGQLADPTWLDWLGKRIKAKAPELLPDGTWGWKDPLLYIRELEGGAPTGLAKPKEGPPAEKPSPYGVGRPKGQYFP